MDVKIEAAYKSLNKKKEELCGDKVELLETENSYIMILADGMGSGVKANILSTLTSKILGTMMLNGASLDECVHTLVKTLPDCRQRSVAYSTFSILQVYRNGKAKLVEFDNPSCIFLRENKIIDIPSKTRKIEGKEIKEASLTVQEGDLFLLVSDGVVHAGIGQILKFGWGLENVSEYARRVEEERQLPPARMAEAICQICEDLYLKRPGDDTTAAVARIIERKPVAILTGPPLNNMDDNRYMRTFLECEGKKIICGGTTANIVARFLKTDIRTTLEYVDPDIPPIGYISGIDLVTEGIRTLGRVLTLLKTFEEEGMTLGLQKQMENKNGASLLAQILLEECTDLRLLIGKTINRAQHDAALSYNESIRVNLMNQIVRVLERLGKKVSITYF